MSGTVNTTRDADIDIAGLFSAIWRAKFKIVLVSLIVTGLMFVLLSVVSPKYKSEARLLIDSSESVFTRPTNDRVDREPDFDEQGIASQVDILTSSNLLMSVASELDLGSRSEFDGAQNISAVSQVLIMLGLTSDPRELSKEKRVLDSVRERLTVFARENSRVIVIEFQSTDKDLAANFPNALADAYLKLESQASLDTTGQAADYLANEIEQLQASVREAERRVADYRGKSGLLVGQNNEILATQQLAELSTELSRVRSDRASAEARARSVQQALDQGQSIDALPDVIQSPIVNRLREQEINLRADLADLSTTLLDNHPEVRALRSQLSDLTGQIRVEAGKVLTSLRNEAAIARDQEAELERSLNQLKAASVTANEQEVELNALEREASTQRALLESYLIRYREAQARQETDYAPAKARLISSATTPVEPTFPKMIPMLAVTFLGTMMIMILVTLLTELFSGRALVPAPSAMPVHRVESDDDQQEFSTDTDGTIDGPVRQPIPVAANTTIRQPDTVSVDELAAALIAAGASRAIVVAPEGDDAATASVGLARAAAETGLRAILVDLTGAGSAAFWMVADDLPGITDLLAGQESYANVIHPDTASEAHCIPLGVSDPVVAARGIARLPMILDALTEAYDLVVVECGQSNSEGLARLLDAGSEIIVAARRAQSAAIADAISELKDGGYAPMLVVDANVDVQAPPPGRRSAYA